MDRAEHLMKAVVKSAIKIVENECGGGDVSSAVGWWWSPDSGSGGKETPWKILSF